MLSFWQSLHHTFSMSYTDGVIWSNPIFALAPSRWWHRHRLVITIVHHTPSHFKVSPLSFLVQLHLSKGVISSHPLCLVAYYDGPVSTDPIRFQSMACDSHQAPIRTQYPNPDDMAFLHSYPSCRWGGSISTPSCMLFKGVRFNRPPCDVSIPSLVMRSSFSWHSGIERYNNKGGILWKHTTFEHSVVLVGLNRFFLWQTNQNIKDKW